MNLLLLLVILFAGFNAAAETARLRIIVETDAGGDPDDEQSLVRFLLYANEWDVEGIIASRPRAIDGENLNSERTGLGIIRRLIHAYGECYQRLIEHDPRFPDPARLLEKSVPGYNETQDAVKLIRRAIESSDPRPIWYMDWGSNEGSATNNLRRALDEILLEGGAAAYARAKSRVRLTGYDQFGPHSQTAPPWKMWVNTFEPPINGRRWYHRFSAITSDAGGFNLLRDVLTAHGPLGALYPTNTTHWAKEGDSMTFLYLVPTGMNEPYEPTWGSWAGRYGLHEDARGLHRYWANQSDAWNGSTNRDNTLRRWAADLQNDFRARLDWCVQPRAGANHPPSPMINGITTPAILRWSVHTGQQIRLDASQSMDPDEHEMSFMWSQYREAGSYQGGWDFRSSESNAEFTVPADAAGSTLHLILQTTDTGTPPLTRYGRVVLDVTTADREQAIIRNAMQDPKDSSAELSLHRPLLTFKNGSAVHTAQDWSVRRKEISREWTESMGSWPEMESPTSITLLSEKRRDSFVQARVRLQLGPGGTGEAWLMTPDGVTRAPAVLVVYYEPETSAGLNPNQEHRDFALQLARRGFVTLSIGTPGGNAWKPELGGASCQPLSFHAYVAARCWQVLAKLPQVDSNRIGIVGHSYGGKWAMFAAALWEPFACVAVSDPGVMFDETRPNVNYWEPWYLGADPVSNRSPGIPSKSNPRTGAYQRLMASGADLHEIHALICPRPFLVSGGAEDPPVRQFALNHSRMVNRLLGRTNRVGFTTRPGHDPTPDSNKSLYAFFEVFLQSSGRQQSRALEN